MSHLDGLKNNKALNKTKKRLKQRFWTEIYQVRKGGREGGREGVPGRLNKQQIADACAHISFPLLMSLPPSLPPSLPFFLQGAKMFYLSGVINHKYLKGEIRNITLYISRMVRREGGREGGRERCVDIKCVSFSRPKSLLLIVFSLPPSLPPSLPRNTAPSPGATPTPTSWSIALKTSRARRSWPRPRR